MQCLMLLSGQVKDINPYYLGRGFHVSPQVVGLEVKKPPNLRVPDLGEFEDLTRNFFQTQRATSSDRSAVLRSQDYLKLNSNEGELFSIVDSGRPATEVFIVSPKHPDAPYPTRSQTQEQYFQWIRENGNLVLKTLQYDPQKIDQLATKIIRVRSAAYALELLKQWAPYIQFNGEQLFDVFPLRWNKATEKTGTYEQDYAFGPNAYDLMMLAQGVQVAPGANFTAMSLEGAALWRQGLRSYARTMEILDAAEFAAYKKKFLESWHLTEQDVKDLFPKLFALEEAYKELAQMVIADKENPVFLPMTVTPLANNLSFRHRDPRYRGNEWSYLVVPIVFDFNHGLNIIYDLKRKRFVVIDG
jgi:hypothetical protein